MGTVQGKKQDGVIQGAGHDGTVQGAGNDVFHFYFSRKSNILPGLHREIHI